LEVKQFKFKGNLWLKILYRRLVYFGRRITKVFDLAVGYRIASGRKSIVAEAIQFWNSSEPCVCVCLSVCLCMYVYVWERDCVCLCLYVQCMCMWVRVSVCIVLVCVYYLCVWVRVSVFMCVSVYVCVCVLCQCVFVFVRMWVCVNACVCMCENQFFPIICVRKKKNENSFRDTLNGLHFIKACH